MRANWIEIVLLLRTITSCICGSVFPYPNIAAMDPLLYQFRFLQYLH